MNTISRWLLRFPLLSAIAIGVISPLAFGRLAIYSCPHDSGLFWLPLASAECPGEFLGQLGFLITAIPGLTVLILLMVLASSVAPAGHFLDSILPAEISIPLLCLLPNLFVWWLVFTAIRRAHHQNRNESGAPSVS